MSEGGQGQASTRAGGVRLQRGVRAKALYRGRSLYGEVQGIMSNGHMGHPLWTNTQTQLKALPSRNFVDER